MSSRCLSMLLSRLPHTVRTRRRRQLSKPDTLRTLIYELKCILNGAPQIDHALSLQSALLVYSQSKIFSYKSVGGYF